MNTIKQYPVLTASILAGLFGLAFKALASYGLNVTPEMQDFITGVIMVGFPIAAALVAQRYTTWWQPENPLVNMPDDVQVK